MANKKIISATVDHVIPKKAKIANSKDIVVKLSKADKYDVYQKDFPTGLPAGYIWVNNFGIKTRKKDPNNSAKTLDTTQSDPFDLVVDEYYIELPDVEGKEPVYFDGQTVKNFPTKKESVGNGRVRVALNLGDPPVGWP